MLPSKGAAFDRGQEMNWGMEISSGAKSTSKRTKRARRGNGAAGANRLLQETERHTRGCSGQFFSSFFQKQRKKSLMNIDLFYFAVLWFQLINSLT